MKAKVLILNRAQFGYHIDTYYYCKYGRSEFDITYLGFDGERPKLEVDGVNCKYVSRKGGILARYLRLLFSFISECRKDYDVIFVKYFVGCAILRILNHSEQFIFDIRTGSVSQNSIKRWWNDFVMRTESRVFKHVSVISQSLVDKLKLPNRKVHILPLGAEPVDVPAKQFGSLRLLYVGTFGGRRIGDTVNGFARFYSEYGGSLEITYDIVGDGYNDELDELRRLVDQKGLSDVIRLPGYIHQSQLKEYYERSNIGVSYVPINDIYNCQPPTKTFEYILAGMPVIATDTTENRRIIKRANGVLVDDNIESFYEGLLIAYKRRHEFDSRLIKQSCLSSTWEQIVTDSFIPYVAKLLKE